MPSRMTAHPDAGEDERIDILPPSCPVIYTGEVLSDATGQSIQTIAQKSLQ
ncbi:hypothetical protein MA16_Dca018269 [Dendrobium catenatum]|uniref:Uncharacterized protein n=1 Tax=Dendrobium catenatum TaxID=906689 RepID=A0A2I0XBC9_9ASPA|nr:hypothetical protein MA16_Dca018269 [Dendrobium catenatum]